MKNIKEKLLDKYITNDYQEVAYSVYLNKSKHNYCFAYECELEEDRKSVV